MKFDTTRFGEVEIQEEDLIVFEHGIPGFEDEERFVLIPYDEQSPFLFLQSVKTKELSFLVIIPFNFYEEYSFELDDAVMEELAIDAEEDIVVYSILTMHGNDITRMTANLLAPIVINSRNKKAKQVILDHTKFSTRYNIFKTTVVPKGGK